MGLILFPEGLQRALNLTLSNSPQIVDSLGTIRKEIYDPVDNSCRQIQPAQFLYEYSMICKVKRFFIVKENSYNCSTVAISFLILGPVVNHVYQRLGG